MAKFMSVEIYCQKNKDKGEKIMLLFGSAAKEAGKNKPFEKFISEEIERTKVAKENGNLDDVIQNKKLNAIMSRVTDYDGMGDYEASRLGLIYNHLAPDDISHPISAKMVRNFLEIVSKQNPDDYEKIWSYYDYETPKPEKYMKKLGILVENILSKYRTVEYCYMYSKAFRDFVEKYASVVDADGLSNIEKIKWLRLWLFIVKDQGFFWTDIKADGKIYVKEQIDFDREVYLFPDCMIYLEKYISEFMEDKSLNIEMLKRLIGLYPENVQKEVYIWAEMEQSDTTNMLRAGEVRMGIKRKLFPITWMSPLSLFCLNNIIKDNNPEYLKAAVIAYKNGGVEKLARIEQRGTDPFDRFRVKSYKSYVVYSFEENGIEKVLTVNSQQELEMFVELYKYLLEHPDFKFGPENKTIYEYGMDNLLKDEPELNTEWFWEMSLIDTDDDINWDCFDKVLEGMDEFMNQYLKGQISAKGLYDILGFATDMQAKVCCNKKTKLIPAEASKMSAALKRIKMFGEAGAIKSDKIYLEIFKYMMSEKPEELPKSMVNLYGKIFK